MSTASEQPSEHSSAHPSDQPLNLTTRTCGIPFGTYQPSGEAEPPAHEVLVGREGQRAYFIQLLLRLRPRGALLVTGRRGVGKTSFVHRTLAEYRGEIFERFVRGNVGRAFFWDILGVFAITFMVILGLLMVAEVTELLTLSVPTSESAMKTPASETTSSTGQSASGGVAGALGDPDGPPAVADPAAGTDRGPSGPRPRLIWLLIVPLAMICAYPLLYARSVVDAIWMAVQTPGRHAVGRLGPALRRLFARQCHDDSKDRVDPVSGPDQLKGVVPPESVGAAEGDAGGVASLPSNEDGVSLPPGPALSKAPGWFAILLLSAVAGVAWFFGPFGAPTVGLSRLLAALAFLYLWVQISSFNWRGRPTWRTDLMSLLSWSPYAVAAFLLIYRPVLVDVLLPASRLGGSEGGTVTVTGTGLEAAAEVWLNFAFTLLFLGGGALRRWAHSSSLQKARSQAAAASAAKRALSWYRVAGWTSLSLGVVVYIVYWLRVRSGLLVLFALVVVGALYYLSAKKRSRQGDGHSPQPLSFRPRPLVLLGAKVIVAVVVSLQLLHPVASLVLGKLGFDPPTSASSERAEDGLRPAVELSQVRSPRSISDQSDMSQGEDQPVGVFHGSAEERYWILMLFSVVVLVAFLEYEWVIRPFSRLRQDRALDLRGPDFLDDQLPNEVASSGGKSCAGWPRELYRDLAELTIPWVICKAWLPCLLISVNLGFERLDHRRVIHAMLAGLRNQYHRTFLSWRSPLANVGRFAGLLLLLMLTRMAGDHYFGIQHFNVEELDRVERQASGIEAAKEAGQGQDNADPQPECDAEAHLPCLCSALNRRPLSINHLICQLPKGNLLLGGLYFDLLGVRSGGASVRETDHLLFYFLPFSERRDGGPEVKSSAGGDPDQKQVAFPAGVHFRVYHLFLFFVFLLFGRYLLRKLPILPYGEVVTKIDEVMDNLSARTSITARSGRWKPAHWLQGFFTDERVRQTEQEPVDPRTIEYLFLHILEDMRAGHYHLPGGHNQFIGLPAPEITFLFDELDKLGTRITPPEVAAGGDQGFEILNAERRRSLELHKLLADMKSLLSSAPARFIFVGGRNLHDEWLADQTARQPLLTNIFDAEVYLPALITDQRSRRGGTLHEVVAQYLVQQARRARALFERTMASRWQALFALPVESPFAETFCQAEAESDDLRSFVLPGIRCLNIDDGENCRGAEDLIRDFVQFLTYRSMGNPKKLKELLGSFIRPVGRVLPPPGEPGSVSGSTEPNKTDWSRGCQHVLRLGDLERFRIQLLADVYRHLTLTLGERLVHRDDKLAISVFFLADFLFKFHGRAFSWSNLERVDELVHIHRAPDLREVLEAMVLQWSERFLHPILNGMYDFRFRSDLAHEVKYISRQSPEEMAAFNFTLDESLTLKSLYESNIARLSPAVGQELQDLVSDLGELHEFDQEFENARFHYRREISLLDEDLEKVTGWRGPLGGPPTVFEVTSGSDLGQEKVRKYMTWGITRLRLMLQIGMTFELSRNLERAEIEYRDARTLARALLYAMLDDDSRLKAVLFLGGRRSPKVEDDRLHALKHLNILFQPAFAEAWVAEKLAGGVDTSITLVERELWELRNMLPFLREAKLSPSESVRVKHSNFALIAAELHNKAGDLYLFKGRQRVLVRDIEEFENQISGNYGGQGNSKFRRGLEGYLLMAYYHYALGLHELRRFVSHRRVSSKRKLNIWEPQDSEIKPWKTIKEGRWPDFVFRSVGGALADLAEAMVGRISLYGLVRSLPSSTVGKPGDKRGRRAENIVRWMVDSLTGWLDGFPIEGEKSNEEEGAGEDRAKKGRIWLPLGNRRWQDAGRLDGWLGDWTGPPSNRVPWNLAKSSRIIQFPVTESHSDPNRLLVSLLLSLSGARFLERGGYLEDAARDLVKVSESIGAYLWMTLAIRRVGDWCSSMNEKRTKRLLKLIEKGWTPKAMKNDVWWFLADLALYSLKSADDLFRRSRRAERADRGPSNDRELLGDKLPVAVLTRACSLGLVVCRWIEWLDRNRTQESGRSSKLPDLEGFHTRLRGLIDSWTVATSDHPEAKSSPAATADWYRSRLWDSLVRHSYPMINRLHGSKALIDDRVLGQSDIQNPRNILSQAKQLRSERSRLDANLHFTPFHAGTTFALLYLRLKDQVKDQGDTPQDVAADLEKIRRAGQRDLNASIEMYTMQRGFYEAISGLYYLYDDFNDRQIHFNHAVQMAGAEVVALLATLVDDRDRDQTLPQD